MKIWSIDISMRDNQSRNYLQKCFLIFMIFEKPIDMKFCCPQAASLSWRPNFINVGFEDELRNAAWNIKNPRVIAWWWREKLLLMPTQAHRKSDPSIGSLGSILFLSQESFELNFKFPHVKIIRKPNFTFYQKKELFCCHLFKILYHLSADKDR